MTRPQPTAFEGELERRLAVLAGFASYIVLLAPDEQPSASLCLRPAKPQRWPGRRLWLDGNATGEVLIDGPFITGDQFALFIDMEITRRATGARQPFSEIATYTVRGGAIVEERFLYG